MAAVVSWFLMYNWIMDRASKILLVTMSILLLAAIGYSSFRFLVARDFFIDETIPQEEGQFPEEEGQSGSLAPEDVDV